MFARISHSPLCLDLYQESPLGLQRYNFFLFQQKKHIVFASIYEKYTNFAS